MIKRKTLSDGHGVFRTKNADQSLHCLNHTAVMENIHKPCHMCVFQQEQLYNYHEVQKQPEISTTPIVTSSK